MASRRLRFRALHILPLLLAAAILSFAPAEARALDNGQCNDCHGDRGILEWSPEDRASNVEPGGPGKPASPFAKFPGLSLHVDPGAYKSSVHGDLSCTDCHGDIRTLPHKASLARVDCSGCHGEASLAYAKGSHVVAFGGKPVAVSPACADCHGAHAVPPVSDKSSPVHTANVSATCGRCHGDGDGEKGKLVARTGPAKLYEQSVHHRAIAERGSGDAATCVSCHGAHDMKDWRDPSSPVNRDNLAATCGNCHPEALDAYKDSVHGVALARGIPDAPGCGECHGTHGVLPSKGAAYGTAGSPSTACSKCHAAEKLGLVYGVATGKVEGYEKSFHGLSAALGDTTVADCASCHGNHAVFPSSDARSTIHPANIPETCGKCHPGASENFAKGNVHAGSGGEGGVIKKWVEDIYIWLIVLVIGGMLGHNALDFFRKMQAQYRARQKAGEPTYERLNRSERIQHFLTLGSFIVLVITGFALRMNWSVPFVSAPTSVFLRAWGHRIAAIVMTLTSLYHVYYALFTPRGRGQLVRMMPRWKDARDVWGTILYFLGRVDHKPKFERFSYVEKAEYLALVWGTVVMILTGALLWFEEEALRVLPLWGLDVVNLIHFYEAILATLAIIVWHFYYVFVNPDFAPMSLTWLDGKLTRRLMEHEHALELEEIDMYERAGGEIPPDVTRVVRAPEGAGAPIVEEAPEDEGSGHA